MRPDMDKVIVERPRYGSRSRSHKKGYRKYLQSMPLEDRPRREPLAGHWRGLEKGLNEHLGPLRRFLRSNIGRPWDKVHSELSEHISCDNAVQSHVLDHVDDYVHKHVEVEDSSRVYMKPHIWWTRGRLRQGEMYVCPATGILKVVRHDRRHSAPQKMTGGSGKQFLLRGNVWWEVQLRKKTNETDDLWDVWLEREVATLTKHDCIQAYGDELIAISKRPLNREETKQLYRKLRSPKRRK